MNLNGKVINPGDLNVQITLKKRAVSVETGGFQKASAGDTLATVWAKWVGVHGGEAWTAAAELGATQLATITIRYRADVDSTCLVTRPGEVWEIVSPDDIQLRHEYIEIKIKRVTPG